METSCAQNRYSVGTSIFTGEQPPHCTVEATQPSPSHSVAPLVATDTLPLPSSPSMASHEAPSSTDMTTFAREQPPHPKRAKVEAVQPTPSCTASPPAWPRRVGGVSIQYCTLQPLFAERVAKIIKDTDPVAMTMEQLMKLVCQLEVTAQLYTFEGVPLLCNQVTAQYSLEEWHVTDGSFFWVIFHSTEVEDDTTPPETLPALDPSQGSTQIFVRSRNTITIMVDLSGDDGQTLRQKIYSKTRTPTSVISLSYGGRLIYNDQAKLQDYNIDHGSTLHMWISPQRRYSAWDSVFQVDLCRPIVQQTASGMSTFNSCLRVLADDEGKAVRNENISGYLLHISQCPPLVLALKALFGRKALNKAHRVAIHEGLYEIFRAIVPTAQAMVPPNSSPGDDSVFDHSISCCAHLLTNA